MSPTIAIRLAQPDEAPTVRRLAALDSAPVPAGDVLLALVDGLPVAGIGMADGRVVADPFVPTLDVVALLRLREASLRGARAAGRSRRGVHRLRLPLAA